MLCFNQKYWGNLARKEWLVKRDRNSTFLQRWANIRRKKQDIIKLKDDTGVWIDDPSVIRNKFVLDYIECFKSIHRMPRTFPDLGIPTLVSQQENEHLTQLPIAAEIKKAVFDINSNKTPGPDGFNAGFFQHYWDLVGSALTDCIKDFFFAWKTSKGN